MRKIIDLAVAAAFVMAANTTVQSAATFADPRSAAEFMLKTCLPAMEDLAEVEVMARENSWFTLPPNPAVNPKFTVSKSSWRANGYFVSTWIQVNGNVPHCVVGPPHKAINRDEFFNAISAAVELKLVSDRTFSPVRIETYEISDEGPSKLRVDIATTLDGAISAIMFYKVGPWLPDLPDR
jgi:hypothetical protein